MRNGEPDLRAFTHLLRIMFLMKALPYKGKAQRGHFVEVADRPVYEYSSARLRNDRMRGHDVHGKLQPVFPTVGCAEGFREGRGTLHTGDTDRVFFEEGGKRRGALLRS